MEDDNEEEVLPQLFVDCRDGYNLMLKFKSTSTYEGKALYRGHLTKLFEEELGFNISKYSRVTKHLQEMGCIHRLKRGSNVSEAEWVLIGPPELESFEYAAVKQGRRRSAKAQGPQQKINMIVRRLSELEAKTREYETRITTLEERLYGTAHRSEQSESGD